MCVDGPRGSFQGPASGHTVVLRLFLYVSPVRSITVATVMLRALDRVVLGHAKPVRCFVNDSPLTASATKEHSLVLGHIASRPCQTAHNPKLRQHTTLAHAHSLSTKGGGEGDCCCTLARS